MRLPSLVASLACPLAAMLLAGGAVAGPDGNANVAVALLPSSSPACSDLSAFAERALAVTWGDYGAIASREGLIGYMNGNRTRTRDPGILAAYDGRAKFRDSDLMLELDVYSTQVQLKITTAQPACLWFGVTRYK